jgi:c(7)-type cytochrome triheme protein
MKRIFCVVFLLILFPVAAASAFEIVPPEIYGRVIINNYSEKGGLAPVVFDHWLHRAKYTCRLCHVDIGFVMKAGASKINAAANMKGFYCGACHNGKRLYAGKKIFASCAETFTQEETPRCERCHSLGKNVKREYEFEVFIKGLPKQSLGNRVDWEKAEMKGFIKPIDFLEGISIRRPPLKLDRDVRIESRATWMPDVLFSHKKHAVWNGCEVCHPEIFPIKRGSIKYSMFQISEGEYCGVCHDKVAFPLIDCQRCHTKPVRY